MPAPVNTTPPAITGTAEVGNALSTDNGSWDNSPVSYAYQWLRGGVSITGETASSYTVQRADVAAAISVTVTATNGDGSDSATSSSTSAVPTTLTVETGSQVANADSYLSISDADTYHAERGNSDWAALNGGQKESALRKATEYLVQKFRTLWLGSRVGTTQGLDWPREGVYLSEEIIGDSAYEVPETVVPDEIKNVTARLALSASSADLLSDEEQVVTEEKLGPLVTKFSEYSPQEKRYRSVQAELRPFLKAKPSGLQVRRA